ncbi:beta-ketoacyl-[acyl-carrier-protein] synthase family protein [Micromonospora sp. WMMA1363]|uniref:beta-ketoacyl-[acyl-carrier-protein] synthase family protein n=1 Tax=Micromonospora sp. WMMA1363 TaxID=3053985 RepID=UPI00259C74DC|nr:beta-ketoacyl-[acyl-carrier-protein] synthase family protein [Micromonospora sp. WMMA1363]MDM4718156.1 beta-ketoacyl-[acyl-carrier-protein] synthase family protein [Micromonospora sp. WMMA1363]
MSPSIPEAALTSPRTPHRSGKNWTDDPTGRVVVTGFGVVSSIGSGRAEYLAGLRAGRCGAKPISKWDATGFPHDHACEVTDFDPASVLERLDPKSSGQVAALAAAASRMAVRDAGLDLATVRDEAGLIAVGTTCGQSLDLDTLAEVERREPDTVPPGDLARLLQPGRLATAAAAELDLRDVETLTIPTACAAGNYAISYGVDAIRSGDAEYAICGGADAVNRMAFAGFVRMGAMAHERCRPFDRHRDGTMWGEGAAMLVLEGLDHARRRGAPILAEVLGLHLNCDADHPTAPVRGRVAECMTGALLDAGVDAGELDVIFAHATGTRASDPMEVGAIRDVLGDRPPPPVVGVKSMIGHTMGAVGAHTAIAALLAMQHQFLPPTVNFREPDPDCQVDCVPNVARPAAVRTALVNSLGFGGNNATLVLRGPGPQPSAGGTDA